MTEVASSLPAACVIGWPAAHSRSPLIHRHWLSTYGIAGDYRVEAVPPDDFPAFVRDLAARGYVGANVTVPHKEAALALGATRWEMIRTAVLPYSRAGISGAAMLGLGRALGETIAVLLVIGNAPQIGDQIFAQGYTLAAVIANEFGEASTIPLYSSALFACGLLLFVVTLIVNAIARYVVRLGDPDVRARRAKKRTERAARKAAAAEGQA